MVFNKKFRFLVLLVLLISFFSNITLAAFPSLDFSTTNFPQGQVDISGKISSGVELELYVNNNYIGKQNILAPIFIINLTNEISNIQSPLGAVTRFVNSNPSKIFIINITGVETKTLNYGETYDIQSFDEGSIIFRNEAAGVQKNILFTDTLINFTFSDITQSYLLNGENNIQFILKHSRDKDI